jgi:hypothetical protein
MVGFKDSQKVSKAQAEYMTGEGQNALQKFFGKESTAKLGGYYMSSGYMTEGGESTKESQKRDLVPAMMGSMEAQITAIAKVFGGASDDMAKQFTDYMTMSKVEGGAGMGMMEDMAQLTKKDVTDLYALYIQKSLGTITSDALEAQIAGLLKQKDIVENPEDYDIKTGKDMMVKVQDAMVQADSGDEINFAPKGFFNGFTDVTAKVYDQLTSLYTAVATMKKEELSRPAIVQALEAAPVSPVDNSNTTKAIDNLATAISDKPIIVTIDGREVARTLYNQSMKVG